MVARLLHVKSPIGKELDSLADMVSFGFLPGVVMFQLLLETDPICFGIPFIAYAGFIITVFSALRLAIFNLDERQSDSFRGLPTPANALFITALPLITGMVGIILYEYWVLCLITVVSSYLLVSGIELFALKFKNFSWQDNKVRFTFLMLAVLLLAMLKLVAIPVIILLYIAVSLGVRAISK